MRKRTGAIKVRSAATVTILKAGKMTEEGRKEVAGWLREVARRLRSDGRDYSDRFTSRYVF